MLQALVRFIRGMLVLATLGGLVVAAVAYRERWLPLLRPAVVAHSSADAAAE